MTTKQENPTVIVAEYGVKNVPDAAKFGVGTRPDAAKFGQGTQPAPGVQQAIDARKEIAAAQKTGVMPSVGPYADRRS